MDSSLELTEVRPHPARRPIRRLDRAAIAGLALAVPALAIAFAAQGVLESRRGIVEGAILLLAAGLIFARAAIGTVQPEEDGTAVPLPRYFVGWRPHPGTILLGTGALANVASLLLFLAFWSAEKTPGAALRQAELPWGLYLASVPVALAGAYLLDARPSLRGVLRRNRQPILVLLGLLGVAAVLRLYRLDEIPWGLWFDESRDGLETLKIMSDPLFRPIYAFFVDEPAFKLYLTIPFFWALGPTELALRLPSAIAGALGVVGVYLMGRALFGHLVGLTSSALIATMAWHLTFSRIAFNAVYSLALDAAAFGFLVLGIKTGRRSLFALSGLCLGLGLNFYYVTRLLVVVIGLYLVHRLVTGRMAFVRQHFSGLVLFGLLAAMTASPLVLYAGTYPREFFMRSQNASIQKEIREAGSYQPLYENVRKHLLMFNVQGDGNGRHNLPGAPMLDRATAALAVVGFVLALARWRRSEYFVLVAWWGVMLLGGILSLAFEAPQSLRTIDEAVVAAIFASLPLVALVELLRRLLGEAKTRLAGVSVQTRQVATWSILGLAALAIGGLNVNRYFGEQAGNFSAWNAHSTAETKIGRTIAEGQTVGRIYLGETFMEQPSIHFLAPGYSPHVKFDPAGALPLRDREGATIFLEGEQTRNVDTVRRLYPDAVIERFRFEGGGPPVLHAIRVTPEQVARVQGLNARYWAATEPKGDPLVTAKLGGLDELGVSLPVPTPAYAEWRATLAAPQFGRYAFKLEAPPTVAFKLDETDVVVGGDEASLVLARGNHALSISGQIDGSEPIRLLWRLPDAGAYVPVPIEALFVEPVTNNGLLGSYYRGTAWSGEPGLQQIDPSLQMRFHILPLPRPYSVEWRGKIYIPADGVYRFGTDAVDESWIYVDERMIVDASRSVGTYVDGAVNLTEGFHDIRIRYVDRTGHTYIRVSWTQPGRSSEPLPTELLFPPQGAYPDKVVPPPPLRPEPATAAPARPEPQAGALSEKPAAPVPQKPVEAKAGPAADGPQVPLDVRNTIGQPGAAPGELNQPRGLGVDRTGNVFVADTGNHRIQKFDPSGAPIAAWGSASDLLEPLALAIDSSGRVVVLDSEPGWIKRYTPTGELVDQFGGPDARFYHPRGLAIDAADNVYVADTGGGRVVKFNGKGEQVAVIGGRGNGPGQLGEPTGVAVDPMGRIWVTDAANSKLVRFDPTGTPEIELPIPKAGSVNGPKVVLGDDGSVVVTDFEGGRLIVVSSDGELRGTARVEGLRRPIGIALAPDGRVLVSDLDQHQVFVLSPLPKGAG